MKTTHCPDAETRARQDRIDAFLAKQQAIASEKQGAEAERVRIEAAEAAKRAAAYHLEEFAKAKKNLADAQLQRNLLLENLPRAQAEVERIPADAAELDERWKVFCSDAYRYSTWRQFKQGALIPGEDPPVPPGFRADPCPGIKLYREAPAALKGVQQKLAYLESVIKDIERGFPELRDKAALGLRPFAGRSKNG
jgi:hypothetical protein